MNQTTDWQPELFKNFEPPAKPPWWARYWRSPQRFLMLRIAYEDLVLSAIGGLMIAVLAFCLGVERGRHLGNAPTLPAAVLPTARLASPSVTAPTAPVRPLPLPAPSAPASLPAPPSPTSPAASGSYAVQVASYADRAAALAAQAKLAQRGLHVSLVVKGKYHVLLADGFVNYAQATAAANQLRAAYSDCFVRKLTPPSPPSPAPRG